MSPLPLEWVTLTRPPIAGSASASRSSQLYPMCRPSSLDAGRANSAASPGRGMVSFTSQLIARKSSSAARPSGYSTAIPMPGTAARSADGGGGEDRRRDQVPRRDLIGPHVVGQRPVRADGRPPVPEHRRDVPHHPRRPPGDQHEPRPGRLHPGERGDGPIRDRPVAADDRPVKIGRHQQRRDGAWRACAPRKLD